MEQRTKLYYQSQSGTFVLNLFHNQEKYLYLRNIAQQIQQKTGINPLEQKYYFMGRPCHKIKFNKINRNEKLSVCRNSKIRAIQVKCQQGQELFSIYLTHPQKTLEDCLTEVNFEGRARKDCFYDFVEFPYGCDLLSPISNISDLFLNLIQKPRQSQGFLRLLITDHQNLILHPIIHGSKTIGVIYDLLHQRYRIQNFLLAHQERYLERDSTLFQSEIQENSILEIVYKNIGGLGFQFIKPTKSRNIPFNPKAPDWRIVKPGLSIKGRCNNSRCQAGNNFVISNYGYGFFQFPKDFRKARCPICKQKLENAQNCGFSQCQYFIEGEDINGREFSTELYTHGQDDYKTFEDEEMNTWEWITIECNEIEKDYLFSFDKISYFIIGFSS